MFSSSRAKFALGGLVPALALAASLWARPARADATAEIKAAARDLAIEGINLAKAGRCGEALEKLERAEKLYHAPSILTWVGECQINVGRLVDGTESLNQVVRENIPADAPDAYRDAQARAQILLAAAQPKIARLTIDVTPADAPDLQVTVNGRAVPLAMIGAPRPTDPGKAELTVKARGYFVKTVTLTLGEGQRATQMIVLEADPAGVGEPPPAATNPPQTATSPTPPATASGGGGDALTTVGWITLGTGAAVMIGGGVFGGLAIGDKSKLGCPGNVCSTTADIEALDAANSKATISTVLFVAGGVLAGAGITMLVWPKSDGGEKAVSVTPNSIRFSTTF